MVRPGYQETEIGLIPKDWTVGSLGEKFRFIGGGTPSKNNLEYWNGDIPWVSSSDLCEDDVGRVHIGRYITKKALMGSATQLCPAGSVLVVSRVGVGKVAVAEKELCTSQDFTNIVCSDCNSYFLAYALLPIMKELARDAQGTSIKGVTISDIKNLKIGFPPSTEQDRIAEALLEGDKLIDFLGKEIAKKKAIKQGVMQDLLTGKTRLPGFSGEWDRTLLKRALTIKHGASQRDVEAPDGQYPILGTGGIIGYANSCLWHLPSVLIGRKGTINHPRYVDTPFWAIDTLFYTEIREGYWAKFLYYVFCLIDWLSYNEASGVPSLSAKTIENIEVSLPPYEEQQAIAAVLSDLDDELIKLEQKLHKYRQIKHGMMQQLLTGKVRLV